MWCIHCLWKRCWQSLFKSMFKGLRVDHHWECYNFIYVLRLSHLWWPRAVQVNQLTRRTYLLALPFFLHPEPESQNIKQQNKTNCIGLVEAQDKSTQASERLAKAQNLCEPMPPGCSRHPPLGVGKHLLQLWQGHLLHLLDVRDLGMSADDEA